MKKIFVMLLIGFVFACTTKSVFAANVEVIGNVNANGTVVFKDSSTGRSVATKEIDMNGSYSLIVPQGIYDISIIPLQGSNIPIVTKNNIDINTNSVENITVPVHTGLTGGNMPANVKVIIGVIIGVILLAIAAFIYFLLRRGLRR